jgi:hypothetical protein
MKNEQRKMKTGNEEQAGEERVMKNERENMTPTAWELRK